MLRGIPDLLVIYLFYFGGSAVRDRRSAGSSAPTALSAFPGFLAGSLAIGIISGAHQTEVFRGAFKAVHPGEIEAARRLRHAARASLFRRIIAPLTLRHALPGLGNVWQVVLKESALVSVTGVVELLRQAQIGAGSTGQPFDFLCHCAALIYLIDLDRLRPVSAAGRSSLHARREEGLMDLRFLAETFVSLISAIPLTLELALQLDRARRVLALGARADAALRRRARSTGSRAPMSSSSAARRCSCRSS